MYISYFGYIVIFAGVLSFRYSYKFTLSLLLIFTIFGAVESIALPAVGGSTILPASLFSVFAFLKYARKSKSPYNMVDEIWPYSPGFWLLLLCFYGLVSAYFFPRILGAWTEVYVIERSLFGSKIVARPLAPSGGNITQSVYLVGALVVFVSTRGLLKFRDSYAVAGKIILYVGLIHLTFGVLDIITWATGTSELMSWLHTANYAMLTDSVKSGLKRISGSFTEASAYASYAFPLMVYCHAMWLQGYRKGLNRVVLIGLFIMMCMSTSATAYAVLSVYSVCIVLRSAYLYYIRRDSKYLLRLLVRFVYVVLIIMIVYLVFPIYVEVIAEYFDDVLFNKMSSQSGIERGRWNEQAWGNFIDTFGMGVGLGSARGSSFLFTLLSNVGIVGAVLYSMFIIGCLKSKVSHNRSSSDAKIIYAAKWALIASVGNSLVAGGIFDRGVVFYFIAAVASSRYLGDRRVRWY